MGLSEPARKKKESATHEAHDFDTDCREETLSALSRQHDTVGAIQDSVGDVACLGAGWTRLLRHAVQHLMNNTIINSSIIQLNGM